MEILRKISPEGIPSFFADAYAAGAAKQYMPQYRLMAQEIAAVAKGTLLDVGTGSGLVPIEIGRLLPSAQITGIDVSEAMVAIARKNGKDSGLSNVSFQSMNGGALEFTDNSLDMVISTDALHHWKRPTAVLDEIYRCLKPGGEAWVYDGYSDASDNDIKTYIHGAGGILGPCWFWRIKLGVHGFSKKQYNTIVGRMVSQTRFRACVFEQRGVMMRLRLRKQ